MKLNPLPAETIERLANEPGVEVETARYFLSTVHGIGDSDDALATVDMLNMLGKLGSETYMAIIEGIADAIEEPKKGAHLRLVK